MTGFNRRRRHDGTIMKRYFLLACLSFSSVASPALADPSCAPIARGMEIMADETHFTFVTSSSSGEIVRLDGRSDGVWESRKGDDVPHRYTREEFSEELRSEAHWAQEKEDLTCRPDGEESLDNRIMTIFVSSDDSRFWLGKTDGRLYKAVDGDETTVITYDQSAK